MYIKPNSGQKCNIVSVCCVQIQATPPSYSIELEERLRTELFTNYTVQQRPDQKVHVSVSLTILTINELVSIIYHRTRNSFVHTSPYTRKLSWLWSYGSSIYNYLCNQCLSPLNLWICVRGDVYSTQHYVIKCVSALRQVSGFLQFPPPIKLTATILLKYCWKWR